MKIQIAGMNPHRFGFKWFPAVRVALIGLWFWVLAIDLGMKKSAYTKHYEKLCLVCKKPLNPNSFRQDVFFHKECRKLGRKLMRIAHVQQN